MVIVWGSGLYGDVDGIPGIGNVATNFGHLYYLPLVPTGSHFILEQSSDGWRGVPIGWSIKSILMAWLRLGLGFVALVCGVIAAAELMDHKQIGGIGMSIACVAFIAMFIATKRMKFFTVASYERAKQLADQIGLTDQAMVMLDLYYGELSESEAQRKLEELATQDA
ncbi:MAG: hypothetical protein ACKV2Q_20995 [Planctomycetaceae bacterium]